MSFWGKLGKVLGVAAPIIAAPFTGGASLAAGAGGGILSKIGKVATAAAPALSGLAAGKQKGREAENTAAQDEALFKLKESGQHEDQQMDRQTLILKQKERAEAAQKYAYDMARRSALAKNLKDVTVSGVPKDVPVIKFNGGLKPSAFGQEGKDAASAMHRLAMQKLLDGEQFDKLPDLERTAAPEFKKPGTMENVLGGLSTGANAVAGFQAQKEQDSFQAKILQAIEALSGGNATGPAAMLKKPSAAAGVTPFFKPPTGRLTDVYDPNADLSNRG